MKRTKMSAIIIVAIMLMVSICSIDTIPVQAASKSIKVGNGKYSITSKKTAIFDRVFKKSVTTLSIPATVKIGKKTYKVTAIKANALKTNKKIGKLTIGGNVKTIGKNAFYGCKNLKKITIKTTKLTAKSIGSKAFGKLNSKLVVKVPKKKLSDYQALLKSKGITGKKQKIIADGASEDSKSEGPKDVPYEPKEVDTRFGIGEIVRGSGTLFSAKWENKWTNVNKETVDYGATDQIPLAMSIDTPLEVYGKWTVEKKTVNKSFECYTEHESVDARPWFDNSEDLHEHFRQTGHDHYLIHDGPRTIDAMHWVPDENPCRVQFRAELPEGFHYSDDSLRISYRGDVDISNKYYTLDVSGRTVTVTISDVKKYLALHKYYYAAGGDGNKTRAFVVTFNAEMTNTAAPVSNILASVSYSHKGTQKDFNLGTATVLSSSIKINNIDEEGNELSGVGLKLYKKHGNDYKEIESIVSGSQYTFSGIGAGEYKLVQNQVPEGYKKTIVLGIYFTVKASANGTSLTELKVTDDNGNEKNLTGGTWKADLANATLSSDFVTYRIK